MLGVVSCREIVRRSALCSCGIVSRAATGARISFAEGNDELSSHRKYRKKSATYFVLSACGMPEATPIIFLSKPARTAFIRASRGWFGKANTAPDVPRDSTVLTEEDEHRYVASLKRNGFSGPDRWYMNSEVNADFARRATSNWRLTMPVLVLHAEYDYVCEPIESRLAEPMRRHSANLVEATIPSGHWMAQEKPVLVNAAPNGSLTSFPHFGLPSNARSHLIHSLRLYQLMRSRKLFSLRLLR